MRNSVTVLLISLVVFVAIAPRVAQAQKLPAIQTTSVKAPTDIKIDGKPTEWLNFEAYNNANEFFYTISNDKNNLYVVVQAPYHEGSIGKILVGGINFGFKSADKNSYASAVSLIYPYVPGGYTDGVNPTLRRANKKLSEDQVSALNKQISDHIKEIPVQNLQGITEESISIYNDLGIKANGLIDQQKAYTCEVAIPLKYIEHLIDANGKFGYRLQVNGLDTSGKNGFVVVGGRSANPSVAPVDHDNGNFLVSPTYLVGVYTLAQ